MKFSVIIPAYNEAAVIEKTIVALQGQDVARTDFEVIVVDNNSQDRTAEAAREAGADEVVFEAVAGTNFARQKGLEESQGDIAAFLDADCEPPADWLRKIEADLALPGIAAVSGPYDYGFRGIQKKLESCYNHKIIMQLPRILKFLFRREAGVIIGGNFAAKRSVLEKIGGLPKEVFWGDDAGIAMLVSRRVGKVLFDPDLVVKSSPRRFEKSGLFRLTFRYALAYLRVYFSPKYR